jgi:PAS domain-containing protein
MAARNQELAAFLKSRRRRLTPESVGLTRSARRRIDALRREDVAWLADVGITWYTWLEQGRPIKMASATLERVGGALRLDASELEYLHRLVNSLGKRPAEWSRDVAAPVRTLVEGFFGGYACVTDPCWDVLAWNEQFAETFRLDGPVGGLGRNGLWIMFTDPGARTRFPDWDRLARRMVAVLRVEFAEHAGNARFGVLIEALSRRSDEFRAMWSHVEVFSPAKWSVGELRDPNTGVVSQFQTVRLAAPEAPGQTLVFYVPETATA